MKLTKVAVIALVSTFGLSGLAATANAAVNESVPTKGKVEFKAPTNPTGPVVKPDTEDTEIETEGGHTTGTLRIEHAPHINFGKVIYRAGNQTFQANNESYTYTSGAVTETQYIPNFLQVTDERGIEAEWAVTVSSTVLTASATDKLDNTKIVLKEQKLTNNVFDYVVPASTSDRITGFSGSAIEIPTDGTNSVEILKTKAGKSTNGSKSSIVFNSAYTESTNYVAPQDPANETDAPIGKNSGITLVKPQSDSVNVGKVYQADLVWTISSAI